VPEEQLAPFAKEVIELGLDPANIVLEAPVGPAGTLRRQLESVFAAARDAGLSVGLDNVRSQRDLDAVDVVPDFVKLDRTMVRSVSSSSGARSIGAVVRDCTFSEATLVAQGIESADQLHAVRDLGVRYAQGWELGRPGAIPSEVDAKTA
jgi:EAL domain-containing protein (putative c-di-GMP-specific phosphodiesterase class I)